MQEETLLWTVQSGHFDGRSSDVGLMGTLAGVGGRHGNYKGRVIIKGTKVGARTPLQKLCVHREESGRREVTQIVPSLERLSKDGIDHRSDGKRGQSLTRSCVCWGFKEKLAGLGSCGGSISRPTSGAGKPLREKSHLAHGQGRDKKREKMGNVLGTWLLPRPQGPAPSWSPESQHARGLVSFLPL